MIELEEVLELGEVALKVAEEKVELAKTQATVKKSKAITNAKLQAMQKHKAFANFKVEVVEGSIVAHNFFFDVCKVQVTRLFPGIHMSYLDPEVNDDEDKVKEVHKGICGNHIRGGTLAYKVLR